MEKPTGQSEVYETTDYAMFKYIDANRTVNNGHVQALIKSMEKNPELIRTRPILVNEKFEIIDGQHRLQALMALHRPVYYTVSENTGIEEAQVMNALNRGWTIIDFARSYALKGKQSYIKFLEMLEEFNLPPSVLMYYMTDGTRDRGTIVFKSGEFQPADITEVHDRLNKLDDYSAYASFYKSYQFSMAIHDILKNPDYNHAQMMRKLEQRKPQRQGTRREYLRELEDIYNYKQSEETRIRFWS